VALVDEACTGAAFERHRSFCEGRSLAPRTLPVIRLLGPAQRPVESRIFCFANPGDAAAFLDAFGGEPFDPATCRGKGRRRGFWESL
jgi:hypothetical protein